MTLIRRAIGGIFALAAGAAAVQAWQTPPARATGIVVGRAIDSTGAPLSGTQVTLTPVATLNGDPLATPNVPGPAPGTQRVLVDAAGGFVFHDLPSRRYTLTASRAGYLDGALGRRRPGGSTQTLELADGQSVTGLSLTLWKFATISGTVVDEAGEPVVGVGVRILRRTFVGGRPSLVFTIVNATDDRGVYRATSLAPGTYVATVGMTQTTLPLDFADDFVLLGDQLVPKAILNGNPSATSPAPTSTRPGEYVLQAPTSGPVLPDAGARVAVYPPQFHSNADTADRATAIPIAAGEDRGGVNFSLRTVPGVRVTGTLTGPDGMPVPMQTLKLVAAGSDAASEAGTEVAVCVTDLRGAFAFLGVPSGDYVLRSGKFPKTSGPMATTPVPILPTLWLAEPVSVRDRDLTVTASFAQGRRVTGRIEFQGSATKPAPEAMYRVQVSLEPVDGRAIGAPPAGRADATSSFTTYGMPPGRYRLNVSGAPGPWSLRSAMFQGQDLADTPFELKTMDLAGVTITLTDSATEINGVVSDDKGAPDAGASAVLFPIDPRSWVDTGANPRRLRTARADHDGRFDIARVPAGEYFIVAIPDEATSAWTSPAFLEALARSAARLTITDGQPQPLTLRTVAIR